MQPLFLHLGSNLGDRFLQISKAIELLETHFGPALKLSPIYQTKAWGKTNQPDFLNMAAIFLCKMEPLEILGLIKEIEHKLGRKKRGHWYEREIDIDIIFYGNEILNHKTLFIPHKMMHLRRFVLVPMLDLDPSFIHPVLNQNMVDLLANCPDKLEVILWKH
jgi:2-amino-4-hydroxy-6-hydroxymethyldihydropteridine diphosphokinase